MLGLRKDVPDAHPEKHTVGIKAPSRCLSLLSSNKDAALKKLGEERVIWLIHSDQSPSLKEAKKGTQTGT